MGHKSPIEWTDATWNPITGCTLVSDGCKNCYAAMLAAGRLKNIKSRKGLAKLNADGVAQFTGEVRFNEEWLNQPTSWRKPRMIFVCAHGDLFHESVPDEWIDKIFTEMVMADHHTYQILSKRPARMAAYLNAPDTVARVSALVHHARHEKRNRASGKRAIRDRRARSDLENSQTSWSWSEEGRRVSLRGEDHALQEGQGRVSDKRRLSSGDSHDRPSEDSGGRSQASLDERQRPDTERSYDQPQERDQAPQQSEKLGIGDVFGAEASRLGCSEGQKAQATRQQTSENQIEGTGCFGDPRDEGVGSDGQEYREEIRDGAQSDISNLQSQDLDAHLKWPLDNVWIGTSIEDQKTADERIPHLLDIEAKVRFISAEPLLGPIELSGVSECQDEGWDWLTGHYFDIDQDGHGATMSQGVHPSLDWVIVGGETGYRSRPMHPDWARSLRDQCVKAGVPFLFKQWGSWQTVYDRDVEDPDWRNCPDGRGKWDKGRYLNLAGGCGFHGDRVVYCKKASLRSCGRMLDGKHWDGMPDA